MTQTVLQAGKEAKKATRREIQARLSTLSEDDIREQSLRAQELVLSLDAYKDASRLSIYLSMPSGEAQTSLILESALRDGKAVFVPYLYSVSRAPESKGKRRVMDMLRLTSLDEYKSLERDSWGIPSLAAAFINQRENALGGTGQSHDDAGVASKRSTGGGLDLVVVPAVAFDAQMNRLGHGAGFYDAFLTRMTQSTPGRKPYLVGLCLEQQILPSGTIKMEEWDWRVDAVAAGSGRLLS